MKYKFPGIFTFIAGAIVALLLIVQLAFKNDQKVEKKVPTHQWQVPVLPEKLSFAGEEMPLGQWDIKERMDRELLFNYYNPANIYFLMKMANRYFPEISARLKANGVPDDFKYLCVAESNLLVTALSRSGAVSFWQFMDMTAPGYNLTANKEIDERYNLEKATDGACLYFKRAYERFGSWTAAAASYNCGMNGYSRYSVEQQTPNYYYLQLPEETNRYMYRIVAFKHLMENAAAYGFHLEDKEKYHPIPFRTITVDSSIPNLVPFAISNGTTYKMLRLMNPWIRAKTLTVSKGKTYDIRLPVANEGDDR